MTRLALLSANLGEIDRPVAHVPQTLPEGVTLTSYLFTDENFPPRICSMTPRMQAKICKLFGWQLVPGYDAYLWLDASLEMARPDTVAWLLEQAGDADLALFRHPHRDSIRAEAQYLRDRFAYSKRLQSRYANERLDEQLEYYLADPSFTDTRLFAAGCLLYRDTPAVRELMWDWLAHQARYHVNDQLSLPYLVAIHAIRVTTIDADIFHCPYLFFTRGK